MEHKQAMIETINFAFPTILTSGTIMTQGLEQLLGTINKVKRQINPKLRIEGILLTMVDSRTNYSKDIRKCRPQ